MTPADVRELRLRSSLEYVLMALVYGAHGADECCISVETIIASTGLSERTVQYALRDLEWRGFVRISYGNGRGNKTLFDLKGCKKGAKRVQPKIEENQRMSTNLPYIEERSNGSDTLSRREGSATDLPRRAKTIIRRQQVRDGYLSLLGAMDDGQYITASGLAHYLGMPTSQVRNDLMALFKSLCIPLDAQFRLRKSQRKPWHKGQMNGKVVNFYDHGGRREGSR
jgi:hypothetical protein